MIILLDRLIAVANRSFSDCINMIGVVEAIVVVVMAYCGDDNGEDIQVGKACEFNHLSLVNKEVRHLKYIDSMDVIMVLNIFAVSFADFAQELRKYLIVDLLIFIAAKLVKNVDGDHCQTVFAPNLFEDVMRITTDIIDGCKMLFVL